MAMSKELKAISALERVLFGLNHQEQRRILNYVSDKIYSMNQAPIPCDLVPTLPTLNGLTSQGISAQSVPASASI